MIRLVKKAEKGNLLFLIQAEIPGDPGSKHGRNAHKNSAEGGEKSFHQSFAGKLPEKAEIPEAGQRKNKSEDKFLCPEHSRQKTEAAR